MTRDNYHRVVLSTNSDYTVSKFGGMKGAIFGVEGLVTDIRGPSTVYFQTKNQRELMDLVSAEQGKNDSKSLMLAQAALMGLRFASSMT